MTVRPNEWIGIDLDGTLAYYDGWRADGSIGAPIPKMVALFHRLRSLGWTIKIFTARVSRNDPSMIRKIEEWCIRNLGEKLAITNSKDFQTAYIIDDRAVTAERNTGNLLSPLPELK